MDEVVGLTAPEPEPARGEPQIILSAWIPGRARPKGSLKNVARRNARTVLQEDNPHSAAWRRQMVDVLGMKTNFGRDIGWPIQLPVEVDVIFVFRQPDGNDREAPTHEVGDLDKLIRNVLDALQDAGVIANDALVVRTIAEKGWLMPGDGEPGAMIVVKELDRC